MTLTAPVPASAAPTRTAGSAAADPRARLHGAAKQFEAIFLRQVLAAARKADFGGEELFGSQGLSTFREMQDENFARIASETGAIGLASRLEAQMAALLPGSSQPAADPPAWES